MRYPKKMKYLFVDSNGKWYTISELARKYGVGATTIRYKLEKNGIIYPTEDQLTIKLDRDVINIIRPEDRGLIFQFAQKMDPHEIHERFIYDMFMDILKQAVLDYKYGSKRQKKEAELFFRNKKKLSFVDICDYLDIGVIDPDLLLAKIDILEDLC